MDQSLAKLLDLDRGLRASNKVLIFKAIISASLNIDEFPSDFVINSVVVKLVVLFKETLYTILLILSVTIPYVAKL